MRHKHTPVQNMIYMLYVIFITHNMLVYYISDICFVQNVQCLEGLNHLIKLYTLFRLYKY